MSNRVAKSIIISTIFLIISIFYTFLFAPHHVIRLLDSYDLLFHWNRVSSLGNIFVSPVNFNYWDHIGNFTNLFYPWLTILPGYIIFQLIGSPFSGFLVFLTVITFFTLVSSYYFTRKFTHNTLQAILFSVIYTLSFFRLTSVDYRSGMAEYLAYVFLPLVFYAFAQILKGEFKYWSLFTLGISLVVLTHPLTAFITIIMLVPLLFLILFNKVSHHWAYWGRLIMCGLKSVILTGLISCGFFVPMIEQRRFEPLNRPVLMDLAQLAQRPMDLLYNSLTLDIRSYSLGIVALCTLIAMLLCFWWDNFVYRVVTIEALLAVVLSTKIIPWSYFQQTFINYLQFPWRFLSLANFFIAFYLSYLLTRLVSKRSPLLKLFLVLITIGALGYQVVASAHLFSQQPHPLTVLTPQNAMKKVQKFTQKDYYPLASLSYGKQIKKHYFIIDHQKTRLPFQTTANSYQTKYYNQSSSVVDVPVLYYKGLHAKINNIDVNPQVSRRGTVQLKTQAGVNNIVLSYQYTLLAKISWIISLVSLFITVLILLNQRWALRTNLKRIYQ